MSTEEKSKIIEERKMAGKAISKTYKGILRISNNIELVKDKKDSFLNEEYYFSENSPNWLGEGTHSTHDFLSDSSAVKRYKTSDAYTNLKVPVTDSTGNFLNFSLGVSSSLIGSDNRCGIIRVCAEQFNENDGTTLAALTTDNYITLGRSKQANKEINGANLNLCSSEEASAKLVILNKKRHSGGGLSTIDANSEQVRTIYDITGKTPEKYDLLVYDQENYDLKEVPAGSSTTSLYKDCYVTLKNLREYIHEEVGNYIKGNAHPVPTGTIISQYCNLDKWYCWDKEKGFNDIDKWQGYRPSMCNSPDSPYSYYNTLQGKFLKTNSYLYYNDDSGSLKAFTSELPPDFKRGYALCNGGALDIHLRPFWDLSAIGEKKSLEILLDLFHLIGYYYQPNNKKIPVHKSIPEVADDKIIYTYEYNNWYYDYDSNHDTCYGITMATILAFKTLDKKFSIENGAFGNDMNACLNWLSKQRIPEEYIFNVLIPDELITASKKSETENIPTYDNAYYSYKDAGDSFKGYIKLGRQISSFSDEIPYYFYDKNTGKYGLTKCRIIDTAEVRDLVSLYIDKTSTKRENWSRYSYSFYLPKLFTTTETDVNEAYRYLSTDKKEKEVSIGQFIGSNGSLIADSIIVPDKNLTVEPYNGNNTAQIVYNHSYGYNAHSHAITRGRTVFRANSDIGTFTPPSKEIDTGARVNRLSRPSTTSYNKTQSNINNRCVVAADYHKDYNSAVAKSLLKNYRMDGYVLQDVPNNLNDTLVYTLGTGSVGYELTHENDANLFKWYGRTSEPIWTEHDVTAKTLKHEHNVGYFTPESIKVLPLIKL